MDGKPPRNRAYNRYMVQIVWGAGKRPGYCKQESLPHVFPATTAGYKAMRASLMDCVDRLDKIIAASEASGNDADAIARAR